MTLPSATYQAMLRGTKANIEHITDECGGKEFMDVINANIRGGASVQFQPYAKANNPRVLRPLSGEFMATVLTNERAEILALHERIRRGDESAREEASAEHEKYCAENGFDWHKETSWISYVDANSLYPTAMVTNLPTGKYEKVPLTDDPRKRLRC